MTDFADHPSDLVRAAHPLAAEAHRDDVRPGPGGADEPYLRHVERVAEVVAAVGAAPQLVAAALLHDVAEDHPDFWSRVREGVDRDVVKHVERLSKRDGEDYPDFIERAAEDADTRAIKLADVRDNHGGLDNLPTDTPEQRARVDKLRTRYAAALERLDESGPADRGD
ncbi:HD domain-containing protein [uncultured Corynebacterium sp.]|uniref:HD domain-containing protein n=1 Tax=uncultured Corynebacterium sp. TaxID=159447 RepID=UPI0025F8E99F|nr:HD domain-containing protein [uncultured Corynebacterium sp.]